MIESEEGGGRERRGRGKGRERRVCRAMGEGGKDGVRERKGKEREGGMNEERVRASKEREGKGMGE